MSKRDLLRNSAQGQSRPHQHQVSRRCPSPRQIRAVALGADELANLAEWAFRHRPRTLRSVRKAYRQLCVFLLDRIERAGQEKFPNASQGRVA
jgi:hypothetical protein